MKKLIAIALSVLSVFTMTACGSSKKEAKTEKTPFYASMLTPIPSREEACEEDDYEEEDYEEHLQTEQTEPTEPQGPSEEELALLKEYYDLVTNTEDISVYDYYKYMTKQEQLSATYNRIRELDVVDKWANTPYVTAEYDEYFWQDISWDRQQVLDEFVVIEDVLLEQHGACTDHLGNRSTPWQMEQYWEYDLDGMVFSGLDNMNTFSLFETNPEDIDGLKYIYEYDDQGRVKTIRYCSGDLFEENPDVRHIATLTYDEAGNMVNKHIQDNYNEYDLNYTYDDQNRLTVISYPYSTSCRNEWTYAYDAAGNMIHSEKTQYRYMDKWQCEIVENKTVCEFTYDSNGAALSGKYTYEEWDCETGSYMDGFTLTTFLVAQHVVGRTEHSYTFECDDQNRIIYVKAELGDEVRYDFDGTSRPGSKSEYATQETYITYGDYYIQLPQE